MDSDEVQDVYGANLTGPVLASLMRINGVSGAALARSLGVSRQAVSGWTKTGSLVPRPRFADFDRSLDGEGRATMLLEAASTPAAIPSRRRWDLNWASPAGPYPTALWLFWPAGVTSGRLTGEWGVFGADTEIQCGELGAVIQSPARIDNPYLRLELEPQGWAVALPHSLPHKWHALCPTYSGVRLIGIPAVTSSFAANLQRAMHRIRKGTDEEIEADLAAPNPVVKQLAAARVRPYGVPLQIDQNSGTPPNLISRRLRVARLARGISPDDLASKVTNALDARVEQLNATDTRPRRSEFVGALITEARLTSDRLQRLEAGEVSQPSDGEAQLMCFADNVLGLDGRGAQSKFRKRTGPGSVNFPRNWSGPIWIHLGSPGQLTLTWGPWQRQVQLLSQGTVTTRKFGPSAGTLWVDVPGDVVWTAGMGYVASAVDINDDWVPASPEDERQLLVFAENVNDWLYRRWKHLKHIHRGFFRHRVVK